MRIGAHQSIAGGLERAVQAALADGCESLQIFTHNQVQWRVPALDDERVERFRAAVSGWGAPAGRILVHGSYLVNLAAPDPELRRRSIAALTEELRRCGRLGLTRLVIHPGAHKGAGESAGIGRIALGIRQALEASGEVAGRTAILLENTAGQGTGIGHRFEHLRDLLDALGGSARVGICLDTQHAFAAGHDLASEEGLRAMLAAADRAFGLDRIGGFHLNDSRRERGARVDRHERVGRGHIGSACFRRLLGDRRFADVPAVLELPPPYPPELRRLRLLADGDATSRLRPERARVEGRERGSEARPRSPRPRPSGPRGGS